MTVGYRVGLDPRTGGGRLPPDLSDGRNMRIHRRPALLALALSASLASCGDADPSRDSSPRMSGPRHVFLISIDTLRADHCGLYGYHKPTTPFLDSLGERGVVFDRHVVNSNNTLISHASMITGLVMPAHNAYDRGEGKRSRISDGHECLAEVFQGAGFQTGAFAAHPVWLAPEFGFDQGFDVFETGWRPARVVNRFFLKWVDSEKPSRIFAFLHYYDVHSESAASKPGTLPYEAPPKYLERFAPPRTEDFTGTTEDRNGKTVIASGYLQACSGYYKNLPPEHLEYIVGCYDAGIAKLDDDLRDLFAELEERGILEESLIVITSDHGEEFKEHKALLHGGYHDEIMHVPMVWLLPRGVERGTERVTDLSRSIDIAPTLLDMAGLPPLSNAQGISLARSILEGKPTGIRQSLFGMKIIRAIDEVAEFKFCDIEKYYTFYDLAEDPGEMHNLWVGDATEPQDRKRMAHARILISQIRKDSINIRDAALVRGEDTEVEMSPERIRALEALGYLGGDKEEEEEEGSE